MATFVTTLGFLAIHVLAITLGAVINSLGGKNDPPYPPLKKGGTGSEVPLLKGDLGGSS